MVRAIPEEQGARPGRRRGAVKTCSVAGCGLPARAKGLCSRHYQSARYHEKKEGGSTAAAESKKAKAKTKVKGRRGRPPKKTAAKTVRRSTAKKTAPKKRAPRAVVKKTPAKKPTPVAAKKKAPRGKKAKGAVAKKPIPKKIAPHVDVTATTQNDTAAPVEVKE